MEIPLPPVASQPLSVNPGVWSSWEQSILKVGKQPNLWDGTTPFDVFKSQLAWYFRAARIPPESWGLVAMTHIGKGPMQHVMTRLSEHAGKSITAENLAEIDLSWSDFSQLMDEAFGHTATEIDMRASLSAYAADSQNSQNTVEFLQGLDQILARCKEPVDEATKIQLVMQRLRPDMKDRVLV